MILDVLDSSKKRKRDGISRIVFDLFNLNELNALDLPSSLKGLETELGPKTKMDDEGMETFRSSQILKVSAQREISFGCRMNAPSYHSSPYEDTKWFNFRVLSDDTLKSTCDPTNPDCLNETDEPVVVRNSLKLVEFLVEYQS